MGQYTWATCSKVIQSEVNTLCVELQRLLGENFVGMYLHGSLALGGFTPTRSNINIVVVVQRPMNLEVKRTSIALLLRISKMPCPIDIYFLVEQDIFPFQHPLPYDFHYNEMERDRYQQDLRSGTWKHWNDGGEHEPDLTIILTILHSYGICLEGESITKALPHVPEQEFRATLVEKVQIAQEHPLHDPISFVLNACRTLAYLHKGVILSKDAGGVWGLATLPEQYYPLIQQLLALYRGEHPGRPVGQTALNNFADYMRVATVV